MSRRARWIRENQIVPLGLCDRRREARQLGRPGYIYSVSTQGCVSLLHAVHSTRLSSKEEEDEQACCHRRPVHGLNEGRLGPVCEPFPGQDAGGGGGTGGARAQNQRTKTGGRGCCELIVTHICPEPRPTPSSECVSSVSQSGPESEPEDPLGIIEESKGADAR